MKAFADYFSVICFFIAWLISKSIYTATLTGMIAMSVQILFLLLIRHKISGLQWITLASWLIFGSLTLAFRTPRFIEWKPTVLYWALALILIINLYSKKTLLLKRLLDDKIQLKKNIWKNLTWQWAGFLGAMGAVNLFVAYTFSMKVWINFKLFGCVGITFVFAIMQSIYMVKHIEEENKS